MGFLLFSLRTEVALNLLDSICFTVHVTDRISVLNYLSSPLEIVKLGDIGVTLLLKGSTDKTSATNVLTC